jgi:hypothetical protein
LKKIASILLGGMLLFNWVGYRLLNDLLQEKASKQLEAQLDKQLYKESQLISIKIPITTLAYYNSSTTFERVDGRIDIDGIPYQYVKRRIYKDSLELLCIPNAQALAIRSSGNTYFRLVNDIDRPQGQSKEDHSHSSKAFEGDPYTEARLFQISDRHFTLVAGGYYYAVNIPSTSLSTDERPPDSRCL